MSSGYKYTRSIMWRWVFHHKHLFPKKLAPSFITRIPKNLKETFQRTHKTIVFSSSWLQRKQLIEMVPALDQGDVIMLTIMLTILAMMMIAFACFALKCCIMSCTKNRIQMEQPLQTNLINLAIQCEANRPIGSRSQRQDRIFEVWNLSASKNLSWPILNTSALTLD